MDCLFCGSSQFYLEKLPINFFNQKEFRHYKCKDCGLSYLNPIPNRNDLEKMYPPSYQGKIVPEKMDINKKLPGLRFKYKTQFHFINTLGPLVKGCDFGCGTGHFIFNAYNNGIKLDGVEFSEAVVKNLKAVYPFTSFFTIDSFYDNPTSYDYIRLSNVLEHFTNPKYEFAKVIQKLKPGGILLIEGPLERNTSLVNWCKWNYFRLRYFLNNNYQTNYTPTHIFFSNYKNQLAFFEFFGLETIEYITKENAWPYPEKLNQINSPGTFIKYIIGILSRFFALLIPRYGNTFLYVGRKK